MPRLHVDLPGPVNMSVLVGPALANTGGCLIWLFLSPLLLLWWILVGSVWLTIGFFWCLWKLGEVAVKAVRK